MNLSAKILHQAALNGFKRVEHFRKTRLMFINAYVGQYYNKTHGEIGSEPLNMAFNAVRILIPNLVTRNPRVIVDTDYLVYRSYAKLLALSLDYVSKKMDLSTILQRGIVDSIFTLGIFKTGLATSDSLVYFGEEAIDPGQLFVETVDFDDFTFDPAARYLEKAALIGEKIRVERDFLLESGLYDNAVIERLPSSRDVLIHQEKGVRHLSDSRLNRYQLTKLHDFIDLIELWLPGPNVIVTVPYKSSSEDHFLREETYYGPDDGPYTFLTLTPPVPNNPLPVALAGIWHDLHAVMNRVGKKAMDQADAQKDILAYRSDNADDAQEIVDARNLDAVRMEDPSGAQMFSFGGQNPQNVQMVNQLELWFNQMSGNTNLTGGLASQAESATEANILNQNAATGITYMRNQVVKATNSILRKCAWYLHTDPLIELPLIHRETIPAEYEVMDERILMTKPPRVQETQVFLTSEARAGDFLDFAFDIEHDSMAPINWSARLQQLEVLAVRIIPAAASAAQIAAQMGTPFSFQTFVTKAAKLMNLDWIDEIFQSPELVASMMAMAERGPQMGQSKGIASAPAIGQQGGSSVAQTSPGGVTQQRQVAQSGANNSQAKLPVREK